MWLCCQGSGGSVGPHPTPGSPELAQRKEGASLLIAREETASGPRQLPPLCMWQVRVLPIALPVSLRAALYAALWSIFCHPLPEQAEPSHTEDLLLLVFVGLSLPDHP